jgi:hypothetical protein
MTGKQLQKIRHDLCGTDTVQFGLALGIQGARHAIASSVRRLESRPRIPGWYARLAKLYRNDPRRMAE